MRRPQMVVIIDKMIFMPSYYFFYYVEAIQSEVAVPKAESEREQPKTEVENLRVESEISNIYREELRNRSKRCKKYWTDEEDELLLKLVQLDLKWSDISNHIPQTSAVICERRHARLKKEQQVWTREEERAIKTLYEKEGKSFREICQFLKKRSTKSISDRYFNYLKPGIYKGPWSEDEELEILLLIRKNGRRWRYLNSFIPRRTENQIKNRYYSNLQMVAEKAELRIKRMLKEEKKSIELT